MNDELSFPAIHHSSFIVHHLFLAMTPEQWQRVESVLQQALDRAPGDRPSFLEEACEGDKQLFEEANTLIKAYEQAGDFIEQPAITHDAHLLVGEDANGKLGSTIGPYKFVERLGAGGMGEVYLAEDERLARLVALKILPAYFASDDARLRRFQREARAASALNHPNILTIHEVGDVDGVYFIATEYIDGATIRELIKRDELTPDEILDIAEQVSSGLAAAHAAGIVHRDIKPENIMRRTDGLVKILDFGIAKLLEPETTDTRDGSNTATEVGLIMGTVNYMSPEQARGLAVDERTDIWSLGVVIYEMLAHCLPFAGATRMDTIVAILDRPPSPTPKVTALSPVIDPIVHRCLQKAAGDRYASANELLSALKHVRPGAWSNEVETSAVQPKPESRPLVRRFVAAALAIVVALVIASLAISVYRRTRSATPAVATASTAATSHQLYTQMTDAEKLAFIRQQEQRVSALMGDRPAQLQPEQLQVIKLFVDKYVTQSEATADRVSLADRYARAPPYVPLIARSFAARRVPVIIGIYLPMIESAYRPCYENSFGSKGLFQFMPQTAKDYGVSREEMCDVEKMTPAAAHYLADHMAELGDDAESMSLVLLSYTTGATFVRTALRELRDAPDYQRNFWTLYAHRDLLGNNFKDEGAWYVPNFFAAAIIGENPETFGLKTAPLSTLAQRSD
jgi:serine/threonine protein kinase/soluble lytic murein transglycosylase-like protein